MKLRRDEKKLIEEAAMATLLWHYAVVLFFAVCLMLLARGCIGAQPDPITTLTGIQQDKQLHFAVGYIAGDVVQSVALKARWNPWAARALALGTGLLLGTAKETYDTVQPHGHFDWDDLKFTAFGTVFAITVHL